MREREREGGREGEGEGERGGEGGGAHLERLAEGKPERQPPQPRRPRNIQLPRLEFWSTS